MSTGDRNSGYGYRALEMLTTGNYNTAVGAYAGTQVITGSNNTFVGQAAGTTASYPGITHATAIGANASVQQSYSVVLGGVGLSSPIRVGINTPAPDTALQVIGDIKVGTTGTNGCVMHYGGGVIAGTCSSDARLKQDIRPFGPVLDRLMRVQPVHFTWRAAEFPDYRFGTGINAGLIAQEVEKVLPDMVAVDENGFKQVNYSELPLVTLAAVRELKAENDGLRTRLDAADALARTRDVQIRRLIEQVETLARAVATLRDQRQ